ncbi:MAG TPA: VWA domain-containing protein [Polyangiaceae bacterium]
MKIRAVGLWAVLGMVTSSAAAFAFPISDHWSKPPITTDPTGNKTGDDTTVARFTSDGTLSVDARLGQGKLPSGTTEDSLLFASVTGSDLDKISAPPLNLAIVIDRSGSMKGARIANAIEAAAGTIARLRDGDSVTVVSFDTQAQIVVPPTVANANNREAMTSAVRSIRLGGDTCISCGLETAMSEMNASPVAFGDHVSRMLLLSDGATNHGITDSPGLRALADRMRERGCAISTIGVDVDFDEKVMALLAQESNGRHYFVANASELPSVFSQEFDSLLSSVARDAELAIELAPGVELEQVFDRTFRRENGKIIVPFGTFSAKQQKTVLLKLRIDDAHAKDGTQPVASVKLTYRDLVRQDDGSTGGRLAVLRQADLTQPDEIDPLVEARLERSKTASTLTEANALFEQGRVAEANKKLADQASELKATATVARAAAKAKGEKDDALAGDFDKQLAAVSTAESNFAAAPEARAMATTAPMASGAFPADAQGFGRGSAGGGSFAHAPAVAAAPAAQPSKEGKTQVRANQQNASDLAF